MKLALIGRNISHSRSPLIYKRLYSESIEYDLIDKSSEADLPSIQELSAIYDGINITSPYKRVYVPSVRIEDEEVRQLGAINCISFTSNGAEGTNTDLLAVRKILREFKNDFPNLQLTILGHGVMGKLTRIVATGLNISFTVLERKSGLTSQSDLGPNLHPGKQNLVINACSRDFQFAGTLKKDVIFWDYNYDFLPHQNTLPFKTKMYLDGQEMLWLQAQEAQKFWNTTNAKLKC